MARNVGTVSRSHVLHVLVRTKLLFIPGRPGLRSDFPRSDDATSFRKNEENRSSTSSTRSFLLSSPPSPSLRHISSTTCDGVGWLLLLYPMSYICPISGLVVQRHTEPGTISDGNVLSRSDSVLADCPYQVQKHDGKRRLGYRRVLTITVDRIVPRLVTPSNSHSST